MTGKRIDKMQALFKKKGGRALKIAKKRMLTELEKIECSQVKVAIEYFMDEYWQDVVTPAMLALACEAVGGNSEKTIPIAVPMILISGGVDIHDDIIDKSTSKYGRETVYGKYGEEMALLAGDAFIFMGISMLQEATSHLSRDKSSRILGLLNRTFFELGDAEALEITFRNNFNVTPEKYLHVMKKKAADVEGIFQIGAIVGGGKDQEIEVLRGYGRALGLLAILRDDWVDTLETEELRHRALFENLGLPLLYALENHRATAEIAEILEKCEGMDVKDTRRLSEIAQQFGGFKKTRELVKNLANEAQNDLSKSKLKRETLKTLLDFASAI